jgi:hypothetical protein
MDTWRPPEQQRVRDESDEMLEAYKRAKTP